MSDLLKKISGTLLIIAAVAGLFISLGGLYGVWRYKTPVEYNIRGGIKVLDETLAITYDGLTISKSALETSIESIDSLQKTIESTSDAIASTQPLFESIDTFLSSSLPKAIDATKQSLQTAQKSAKVIDSFLRLLSFFKQGAYNPKVPFDEALENISKSLDDIPETATEMGSSISDSTNNLEIIITELDDMAASISDIGDSIQEFISVIDQYIDLVKNLEEKADIIDSNLSLIMNGAAIALTIFLLWLALAQLGLAIQGWELIKGHSDNPQPSEKKKNNQNHIDGSKED